MTEWFCESLHAGWQQRFQVTRPLVRASGRLQDLALFETPRFGRVLALDGVIQVTTGDEFIYHEMLAHVPVYAHGAVRHVCVVGGGDGGLVRELLKHPGVEHVTLVEIDADVITFCREHLPEIPAGAFEDPRTEIVIADGLAFMAETSRRFDLIAIDSTDPIGPGGALFTEAFYADCARCLRPGGIVVNQNGVPFLQPEEVTDTYRRRRRHFGDVGYFLAAVPTYVGGFMALGWAADDDGTLAGLDVPTLAARFAARPVATRYYTPDVHRAAFALPPYIRALIPS